MCSDLARPDNRQLEEVLRRFPELAVVPTADGNLQVAGNLSFSAEHAANERIDDCYEVEISVAPGFPRPLPHVLELGGRIPTGFHKHPDGTLCLG